MKTLITSFALALATLAAHAQVTVDKPWVRATVAQQKATGAFFTLRSTEDAKLLSVSSPAAGMVQIHEMAMQGDVMKMRELETGLPLPAGKTVELKPGGYHVMMMDLKAPIKAGDAVPLTLVFEGKGGKRQTVEVKAEARALGK
ncbi:copper chaperone PCu(A)C [Pelomonas sp. KK5]|uniref:copper chaperone PCu(A)C n=1 Tax=Pelomonas sp. KK5 TaxID=1855730 RepID=UPI00097BEFCE|nr:copper chaperone PCu(A)C [Pelomonas sp. KK5]